MNNGLFGFPPGTTAIDLFFGFPSNNTSRSPLMYGFPAPVTGYLFDTAASGNVNFTVGSSLTTENPIWTINGISVTGLTTNNKYSFSDIQKKRVFLQTSDDTKIITFSTTNSSSYALSNANFESLCQRFLALTSLTVRDASATLGGLNLSNTKIVSLDLRNCTFSNLVDLTNLPSTLATLFLADNNLNCAIPDFSGFVSLTSFSIIRCGCTGTFSSSYFPPNVAGLLRLDGNTLTGGVPAPSTGVTIYYVNGNNFTSIDTSLFPTTITDLQIDNNPYAGFTSMPLWSGLTRLIAGACNYSGVFPTLPNTIVTTTLNLNSITGGLPSTLPATLRFLNVSQNSVALGGFPDYSAYVLTTLNLLGSGVSGNLTGKLPTGLTSLTLDSNTALTGTADISNSPAITTLSASLCNLTGLIFPATFTAATVNLSFRNNAIAGTLPNLNCPGLTTLIAYSNQFTGYGGGLNNSLKSINIQLHNNLLPQSAIDAILADVLASENSRSPKITGCVLNLGGTGNAAPSATGLADKASLVATGNWTVTTN